MERAPHEEQSGTARDNGRAGEGDPEPVRSPSATVTGPIYSFRLKLLVVAVVATSVAVVSALVIRSSDDGDGDAASTVPSGRDGVVAVYPGEGSQALQQDTVRVDLAPGWDGRLTVAGQPIPEAELRRSGEGRLDPSSDQAAGLEDRLEFVPGPDKVMRTLPEGRVCAEVEVWRRATGPDGGATDRTRWCFEVV